MRTLRANIPVLPPAGCCTPPEQIPARPQPDSARARLATAADLNNRRTVILSLASPCSPRLRCDIYISVRGRKDHAVWLR